MNISSIRLFWGHLSSCAALVFLSSSSGFSQAAGAIQAPQSTDTTMAEAPPIVLNEFVVSTDQDKGYGTTHSLGASRVNISMMDTAGTVITMNQQLMRDLGAMELIDSVRFAAGVSVASSPLNGQITLRGQNIEAPNLTDGLPEISISLSGTEMLDMATADRVELIEGPAGVLYGASNFGGLVNRVLKAPLSVPRYSVTTTMTSALGQSIGRVDLDATGPIDQKKKLAYRVVYGVADGTQWNTGHYERNVFMAYVTYDPTPNIHIWSRYEQQLANIGNNVGAWFAVAGGTVSTWIPRTDVADDPWDAAKAKMYFSESGIGMKFFNGHWTSKLVYRSEYQLLNRTLYVKPIGVISFYDRSGSLLGTDNTKNILPAADELNPSIFGSIVQQRQYELLDPRVRNFYFFWDNVVNFEIGPAANKLLAYASDNEGYYDNITYAATVANTPTFDYLHPVHYASFNPNNVPVPEIGYTSSLTRLQSIGAQDNIGFVNDHLVLVGGVRHDRTFSVNYTYVPFSPTTAFVNNQTTFKLGLVVKPVDGVALFYNYSQTFTPQFGVYYAYPTGQALTRQNQIGAMDEEGIKFDLFDSRLVATGTGFVTNVNNQLGAGPAINGGLSSSIPLGAIRADGWDFNLAYQPIQEFALIGGVGSVHSVTNTGIWARGVGQGLGCRFFGTYRWLHTVLKGAMVGLGYEYTPVRAGDAIDSFHEAAYGVWNAVAGYRITSHLSAQANVNNVMDKIYAQSAVSTAAVWPGDPRTLRFNIKYDF